MKFKRFLRVAVCAFCAGALLCVLPTFFRPAAMTEGNEIVGVGAPPASQNLDDFTVSTSAADGSDYVASSNSFNDKAGGGTPSYYLVTQDPARALDTTLTLPREINGVPAGTVIPLAGVDYRAATTGNSTASTTLSIDGAMCPYAQMSWAPDSTFFYDDGTYILEGNNYTRLSHENISHVGLNKDATGEPLAVIKKLAVADGGNTVMQRTQFFHTDIYVENLIFDGSNIRMRTGSAGEFFFMVTNSTQGFFAKDVILQNIGNSSAPATTKAVALNIIYSDVSGVKAEGQRNFEGITVRNCYTRTGYGMISINQSHDCYFKDTDLSSNPAVGTYPVKIEHANTSHIESGDIANQQKIVFSGFLKLPTSYTSANRSVMIQNYAYRSIKLPASLKFARCGNSANSTSGAAVVVFEELQAAASNRAFLEMETGYWFVRDGQTQTVAQQLTSLNTVLGIAGIKSVTTLPNPNIKLVAKADNTLVGPQTIPDFSAQYTVQPTTHLVALQASTVANTLPAATSDTDTPFVTFDNAGKLTLPASGKIVIYNFDFKETARYKFAEAIGATGLIGNFAEANSVHNKFLLVSYTVQFEGQDGTPIDEQLIDENDFATAPNPDSVIPAGYEFDGWYTQDGDPITAAEIDTTAVEEDMVYIVKWKARTDLSYTVHYYLQGTTTSLAASKTVSGQTMGSEVTENPADIADYMALSIEEKLIIGAADAENVIIFYYEQLATPTPTTETTPDATPEATPTVTPDTTPTVTPNTTPTQSPTTTPSTMPEPNPPTGDHNMALVLAIGCAFAIMLAVLVAKRPLRGERRQ